MHPFVRPPAPKIVIKSMPDGADLSVKGGKLKPLKNKGKKASSCPANM